MLTKESTKQIIVIEIVIFKVIIRNLFEKQQHTMRM